MHILMIFFDGWGLGANDPTTNPFLTNPMPTLRGLFDGAMPTTRRPRVVGVGGNGHFNSARATLVPTDATLGVPGLPQSATGQTTIFTGVNAPRAIGEHLGPYPNPALRKILAENNIFQQLVAANRRAAFANAYPPIFFERLARGSARRSATSYAANAANVRYRDIDDLRAGRALSVFVTNDRWSKIPRSSAGHTIDPTVPLITAYQAGENLARLANEYDFTLFEYFLTDAAGHKAKPEFTTSVLNEIDELLRGVIDGTDLSNSLIITTSDHGNVEDTSAKGHTLNPVPTLLIGAGRAEIAPRIHSLTDLTPAIVDWLLKK
jgi:2,3-bisphosphoglycerate-independent phosphoglycerate mutase